jgi:hypothetical protein
MTDALIGGGVSISLLIGLYVWVTRCYVSKDTCEIKQDGCRQQLEIKIDSLHALTKQEFEHIKEKLDDINL